MALVYARSADTVRQRLKYTVVYMQVSMGKMQGMPYFSRFGYKKTPRRVVLSGAADEARTRYLHLGKVALYQMSYGRIKMVPPIGIEPMTRGFSVPCSTD